MYIFWSNVYTFRKCDEYESRIDISYKIEDQRHNRRICKSIIESTFLIISNNIIIWWKLVEPKLKCFVLLRNFPPPDYCFSIKSRTTISYNFNQKYVDRTRFTLVVFYYLYDLWEQYHAIIIILKRVFIPLKEVISNFIEEYFQYSRYRDSL